MKWLLALALLSFPATLPAREREMIAIKAGDPFTIRNDRAYLLFRTTRPPGVVKVAPVFMRIPTDQELTTYVEARHNAFAKQEPQLTRVREKQLQKIVRMEASGKPFKGVVPLPPTLETFNFAYDGVSNTQNIELGRAFVDGALDQTYLVQVVPGNYVLYGATYGGTAFKNNLAVCMCLGTVGFIAKPGIVTDLGYFLGDVAKTRSEIPELRPESGFGPSSDPFFPLIVATVRPVRTDDPLPSALSRARIVAADYRAVGKYFNASAMGINRLVPVPGILAYDEGRVIDVKSGTEAMSGK